MGTDYYFLNDENETAFEMGKNFDLIRFDVATLLYKETAFQEMRRACSSEYYHDWDDDDIWVIVDRLLEWLGSTSPDKIRVVHDEEYGLLRYQNYPKPATSWFVTGGRYTGVEYTSACRMLKNY